VVGLWHSDKTHNNTEAVPDDCLSDFVRKKAKGMKGSMVGAMIVTALCDLLLSMNIVVEVVYGFGPFFS
jgi:hypothetical protein